MKLIGPAFALLTALIAPGAATAQDLLAPERPALQPQGAPFVFSANGPGTGRGASAIGMGAVVLGGAAFPAITMQYTHGLGAVADFFISTDIGISTQGFGLIFFINPGIAARVTGARSSEFNLALRASPEIIALVTSGGAAGIFGATPGVEVSFGSPAVQLSLGVDVPMFFGAVLTLGGRGGGGSGFAPGLRPYLALEGAVSPEIGLFLKAAPLFILSDGGGFAWISITAGVGF